MKKGRVIVAMSGGVDSSVAASLLSEQGYEVVGVSLKLLGVESGGPNVRPRTCCGVEDVADARRVAQMLGIPFYTISLEEEFVAEVVESFCSDYAHGKTPNPCILCNERVKFGSLLKKAEELGARYVATGHYAKVHYDGQKNRFLLSKSDDLSKDQSYVLFPLSQEQLSHTLLPLGSYTKKRVRALAKEKGLPTHAKAESQEICFVADNDYAGFIMKRRPEAFRKGLITDPGGRILGRHRGIPFYTIGQRKGLGISSPRPLYVLNISGETNRITVGEERELYQKTFVANGINWIAFDEPNNQMEVKAKIRYAHREAEATVTALTRDRVEVEFLKPQKAITPGQAVVFYQDDLVLGGGWIEAVAPS
jgi:tRNA-specific 2-thiouridylase